MPQFRAKAVLAGSASGDLFKNTLSRIPTLFGRLSYLASLRDPNLGVYNHHGLADVFGREESRRALAESHAQVFQQWLNLPLAAKWEDVEEYLTSVESARPAVLDYWAKSGLSPTYLPESAVEMERELFVREFEVLLKTLRC